MTDPLPEAAEPPASDESALDEEPVDSAVEDGPDIDLNVNGGDPLPLDDFDDGQDG